MLDFAVELRAHITSFIQHPSDLNSLSRVSSHWLSIARPVLYRTLVLRSNDPYVEDTIALLKRDSGLSKSITSLIIITKTKSISFGAPFVSLPEQWINLTTIASLENVRRVKIDGWPSISFEESRQMFTDIFVTMNALEEISCVDTHWTGRTAYRDGYFEPLSNLPTTLRKFTFTFEYPIQWRLFDPTLMQAYTSITYLEIFLHIRPNQFTLTLPYLRFHKLDTLVVNTALFMRNPQTTSALVSLLIAHPKIQTLSLPSCRELGWLPENLYKALPILSFLSVTPQLFESLKAICHSIREVSYLFLGELKFPSLSSRSSMLQSNSRERWGFPQLKRCCMEPMSWDDLDDALETFKESVDLEWWTVLPCTMEREIAETLANSLSVLPKLARIDFQQNSLPTDVLPYFARTIPTLQEIYVYTIHRSRFEVVTKYEVCRDDVHSDELPLLKTVYELPSTGPYIQDRRIIPFLSINWQEDVKLDGWSHCGYFK